MRWMDDVEAPAKVSGFYMSPYRQTALFAVLAIAFGFLISAIASANTDLPVGDEPLSEQDVVQTVRR